MNITTAIEPAWAETAFGIVNMAVLPGWFLLFFMPKWKHGAWLVSGVIIPGLLSFAYLALVIASMNQTNSAGPEAFMTLSGIMTLFDNPVGVVAGWTHYLAFDLAIGSWEVRESARHQIRHRWVVLCLFFTFMLGPAGLLMFLVIRSIHLKRITLE
jgi:hypothetical protein